MQTTHHHKYTCQYTCLGVSSEKEDAMPQLSLYLTEDQYAKLKNEAHAEKVSLSKWVTTRLLDTVEPRYPDGWADLFGSVSDEPLIRPAQPEFAEREAF